MNPLITKLLGKSAQETIEAVSNVVDRYVSTPEEKAAIKASIESEISSRWKSDMTSDSWLSKNVRPLVLIFLITCTMLLIFIDAGALNFEVKSSWVDLLQLVLITVIGAYFGGRSLEKVKK